MTAQKLDRSKLDALIAGMNASRFQSDFPSTVGPGGMPAGASGAINNFTKSESQTDPSFFSRALDVISRPLYAVQNVIKDTVDQDTATDNPFESAWAGLSGIDKTTGKDVITEWADRNKKDVPDWVKGVGGFASDVVLDPINLIPLSWIGKPFSAASKALSGEKKLREAVNAGEGLSESSRADIRLQGATVGEPTPAPKPPEPTQAAKEQAAAETTANVKAGREDAQAATTAQTVAANPETALPDLVDLKTTTPANHGVKTKPITLKNFDPNTLHFIREQYKENLKYWDTAEEAGREAATQFSKNPKDADNLFRSAFHDDPVLGPSIQKEIADSQPVVTPRVDKAPFPETVNQDAAGKAVIPKPSQARKANDYQNANITRDYTNRQRSAVRREMPDAKFDEYAPRVYDNIVRDLKVHKEDAIAAGDYPNVRLGDNDFPIHPADVLDSLGPENGIKLHLSDYNKAATSSLLQGSAKAIEAKTGGLVGDDLLNAVKEQVIKADRTARPISATRAERVAKILIAHSDDIERRMIENEARYGKRDLIQGETIGAKTAEDLKATLDDPMSTTADKINKTADVNGKIIRDGNQVGVSPGGQAIGAKRAAKDLEDTVTPTDTAGAREAIGAAKDGAKGTVEGDAKVHARQQRQMNRDEKELLEDPNIKYVDLGEQIHANLQKGVHRTYSTVLNFFNKGFRQGTSAAKYRWLRNAAEMLQRDYNKGLSDLTKKYSKEDLNAAYVILSSGLPPGKENEALVKAVKPFFDHIFDVNSTDNVANIATRTGMSIDTFNEMMKTKGLPDFQFPTKIKGNDNPTMADVWHLAKDWKVTGQNGDKLTDFMSRMQAVGTEIATRQAVGTDLVRRFGRTTPAPGYVRIARMPYDRAPMSHFIDNQAFVPREIAYELSNFNRFIDAKTSFQGQKGMFAWVANNVLDPYTRLLKPTQTVFRPGHHVRNNVGDFSMNILSGMNNVKKHYNLATRAMMAGGKMRKENFEGSQELFNKLNLKETGKTLLTVALKGGKAHPMDAGQFYQVGSRNGTLIGYRSAEDILSDEGKGAITRFTNKVMETKPAEMAADLSENTGNWHRMAQLSHLLSNPKFTKQFDTIDDAVQAANETISKFHPDLGGLAAGESKYGRRTLLYYTWMRQAIPTILGASLAKPGRAVAMPKAYYNAQVAMGMDPESYSEPYSDEGNLPDFLRENVGMQLGTHMFNLGTPSDTLADFFSHGDEGNPVKTVGSFLGESLNPLYTLPFEQIKEQELGGRHITDLSDNLDQSIPFLNQLSSLSGVSATGTLGNVFGGGAGGMIDPQRQVQLGQKNYLFNQSALNFLTGLGIQDTENPSYRRLAGKGGSQ